LDAEIVVDFSNGEDAANAGTFNASLRRPHGYDRVHMPPAAVFSSAGLEPARFTQLSSILIVFKAEAGLAH
jgi:hypothetical protein